MKAWMKILLKQNLLFDAPPDADVPPNGDAPPPQKGEDDKDQTIEQLKAEISKLKETSPPQQIEGDLALKARIEREKIESEKDHSSKLEAAIAFNYKAQDWLKENDTLLPETIKGIFDEANKENYGSQTQKASAIKDGIVGEFFAVKENLDLLTDSQKIELEQFKKLTKTEREQRVGKVYDSLFEPSFKMLKEIKKAKAVNKGHGSPTGVQETYRKMMIEKSNKKYIGG